MKKLFHMWVGGLTAGVLWGSFECMWLYLRPLLPFDFLKYQSTLPPENMFFAFLFSILTYSVFAILIVLCLFVLIKIINRFFSRLKMNEALLQGSAFYLTLSLFLILFVGTWYNLLKKGEKLFMQTNILLYFAFIGGVLISSVGISWIYYDFIKRKKQVRFYIGYLTTILIMVATSVVCYSRTFTEMESITIKNHSPKANILFITVDTLRADRLHCYGNERIATPVIDELARDGFLFENAIAQVPTTTASHASIFSSLYPYQHEAENGLPMSPGIRILPMILREVGYRTVAFTAAYTTKSSVVGLGPSFNYYFDSLSSWFNHGYLDELEQLTFYRILERFEGNQIPSHIVNKRVLPWLDSIIDNTSKEPFFMWLHYFDPHDPYEPPEPYRSLHTQRVNMNDRRERFLALYDGEIAYTDSQLGIVLNKFKELGLLKNTLIILTSDHGELFGENGYWGHGPKLYEGAIRVPLIFWWPEKIPIGRASNVVETIDIAPTVLELLGLPEEKQFKGQSLASLILGKGALDLDQSAFSESYRIKPPRLISIRSQKWKYIFNTHNGENELYDLEADPNELRNLIEFNGQVVEKFHKELIDTMGSSRSKDAVGAMDSTTKERLKSLGYIQ